MKSLFGDLAARGLIYQTTDDELFNMSSESMSFYCGFDPTSDSLHLGSLLPLLTMRRFQMAGHKPVALVGGATGLIGDPSGKSQERVLLSDEIIQNNVRGIQKVISQFLSFEGSNACTIVNNFDWFREIRVVDFLRDIGKHFSVNAMLAKDSVRMRIEDREQGISYTEFSYMLLQGYDYYHLNKTLDCRLQLGGSDQWGNITAGLELIRRKQSSEARCFGMTMPLVTKADGTKFGKSESGNIWLSRDKTSPYKLYQFLLQTADSDIEKYLKFFSFKTLAEISDIMALHQAQPEKRIAQESLAAELVALIHGQEEVLAVQKASKALFSGSLGEVDPQILEEIFAEVPSLSLPMEKLKSGLELLDLLVQAQLCTSKGAARKDVDGGGIYINDIRCTDSKMILKPENLLGENRIILRKGKKNYFVIRFI